MYDLNRSLVRLCDILFKKLLAKSFPKRGEILLRDADQPVCHGLTGDIDAVDPELVLDPVQRLRVHVLGIQNRRHQ